MYKTCVIPVILVTVLVLAGCRPVAPAESSTPPPSPPTLAASSATASATVAPVKFDPEPAFLSEPVSCMSPFQGDLLLSPNHDYLLASQDKGRVVALPLSAGRPAIELYKPEPAIGAPRLDTFWPLGWVSPTTCLFITERDCSTNPGIPQATTTLYQGDVVSKTATPVASFTHVGVFKRVARNTSTGKVFVHVSTAIWEMDPVEGSAKTIREELPTWDGLFQAIPSPTGEYFAFHLPFDSHNAIALLNTVSGGELLIHDDKGYSYYPVWSPNGRYVAAFYSDSPGSDLLPDEDGPYPASKSVIVYDTQTQTSKVYSAEGKWVLRSPIWSGDSQILQFAAGSVTYDPSIQFAGEPVATAVDSVWSVAVSGSEPAVKTGDLRVSDLAPEAVKRGVTQADAKSLLHFSLNAVSPEGDASYVRVWDNSASSLWRLESGKDPVRVANGDASPCMFEPTCGGYRVLPMYGSKAEVWLLGSGPDGKSERLLTTASETGSVMLDWIEVLACDGDTLVLAARLEDLSVGPAGMHFVLAVFEL